MRLKEQSNEAHSKTDHAVDKQYTEDNAVSPTAALLVGQSKPEEQLGSSKAEDRAVVGVTTNKP
ncbi:MAG: hypothetical protein V4490_01880 [Pseudomonadota bacterium]